MDRDHPQSTIAKQARISRVLAVLRSAANGSGSEKVRTYIADQLVLTVTEHERRPARRDERPERDRREGRITQTIAQRLRSTVEAVTGRRVTATLSGHQGDPDITFELFLLDRDGAPGPMNN